MNVRRVLVDLDDAIDSLCERRAKAGAAEVLERVVEHSAADTADRARELATWLARAKEHELDWLAAEMRQLRAALMCNHVRR